MCVTKNDHFAQRSQITSGGRFSRLGGNFQRLGGDFQRLGGEFQRLGEDFYVTGEIFTSGGRFSTSVVFHGFSLNVLAPIVSWPDDPI